MRLARFNVLSRREEGAGHKDPGKYTLGLSIPAAASVLVLMVIVAHNAGQYRPIGEGFVAGIVLVLSYLMVSRIRFRSFKDLSFNRKTVGLFLLAAGCAVAVIVNGVDKAFIFLLLITAYIVLGLTETVIFIKRSLVERHLARRAASAAPMAANAATAIATPIEEEDAPPDEEVLRELGAFDPTSEKMPRPRRNPRPRPPRSQKNAKTPRTPSPEPEWPRSWRPRPGVLLSDRNLSDRRCFQALVEVPAALLAALAPALPLPLSSTSMNAPQMIPISGANRIGTSRSGLSGAPRPVANARCMPPSNLCAP